MFLVMANTFNRTGKKLEVTFKALVPRIPPKNNPVEPGQFLERSQTRAIVRFEYVQTLPSVGSICGFAIHYEPGNWCPMVNLFMRSSWFRKFICVIIFEVVMIAYWAGVLLGVVPSWSTLFEELPRCYQPFFFCLFMILEWLC